MLSGFQRLNIPCRFPRPGKWFASSLLFSVAWLAAALEFAPGTGLLTSSDGNLYTAENREPSRFCETSFKIDVPYKPNGILYFDYRTQIPAGVKVGYVAVNFYTKDGRSTFNAFEPTPEWKSYRLAFNALTDLKKGKFTDGDRFTRLIIYTRIPDGTAPGKIRLEVRNIRFEENPDYNPLAGVRTVYSARPLFDWEIRPNAAGYRLEYSTSESFPPAQTTAIETTRTVALAPTVPPAGILYYRVFALPEKKPFAEGRLRLPEKRQEWTLPDYDFDAFVRLPHPRLLAAARTAFPSAAAAREEGRKLLNFSLPPDPKPYREGADPNIPNWIEWYQKVAGKKIGLTGYKMQILGQAAMVSADPELIAKARELALGVARGWDPNGGSFVENADLQATSLMLGVGFCADAAWEIMTPEERNDIKNAIRTRGKQFYARFAPFKGEEAQNHAWDSAMALGFAGLCLADEPAGRDWFDLSMLFYAYRFLPALGDDGGNNEGLSYWAYGLSLALKYVDLVKALTGVNFYRHPYLMQTTRFPMYTSVPDGYASPLGDCGAPNHFGIGPTDRVFCSRIAGENGDRYALWYAGYDRLNGVEAEFPAELPASKYYPHLGMVFFNTTILDGRENVAVGFRAGPHFAGHQHADQNGFFINAYGDKLAVDGGYYDWWGSKHFYGYSIQSAAHNTVLVNGKGQKPLTPGADGRTLDCFDSFAFGYVAGDASAPKIYQGELKSFIRQLVFVKPDLVVVYDRLEAPAPAVMSWLLHANSMEPIKFDAASGEFSFSRPLASLSGRMLLPAGAKMKVAKAFDITPAEGYSEVPMRRVGPEWTLAVENPAPAAQVEFLSAMQVARGPVPADPSGFEKIESPTAAGMKNRHTVVVFTRTSGKRFELAGLTGDGEAAALLFDDAGKIVDALLIRGHELSWRGQSVLSCEKVGDYALRPVPAPETTPAPELVKVGGTPQPEVTLYRIAQPEGGALYCAFGRIDIPEAGVYRFATDGGKFNFVLANAAIRNPGTSDDDGVFLTAGRYLLNLSSRQELKAVDLVPTEAKLLNAEVMPENWQPATDAVRIEAEDTVAESAPPAIQKPNPDASGKYVSANWFFQGKGGEWKFEVPESGIYTLYARTATPRNGVIREWSIDGLRPSGTGAVRNDATGSFDRFRYLRIPGQFELAAGKHRLKCRMIAGLSDMDCFILERKK